MITIKDAIDTIERLLVGLVGEKDQQVLQLFILMLSRFPKDMPLFYENPVTAHIVETDQLGNKRHGVVLSEQTDVISRVG